MPVPAPTAERQRPRARLAFALVRAHLRSRRRHGTGRTSLALAVLGMGAGVMMLTSVLGVMNGLQLGFIEDLVEIGSFHLRVRRDGDGPRIIAPAAVQSVRELPEVRTITPFADLTAMVGRPGSGDRHAMTLRVVPADVGTAEPVFAQQLGLGEAPIAAGTVILGVEAAARLGVRVGDAVSADLIDRTGAGGLPVARSAPLVVAGMFASGFYNYDRHWALLSLATAELVTGGRLPLEYGIKLGSRFRDQPARQAVEALLAAEYPDGGYTVRSWREFNQAFYGALRTEKLLMSALIGLVFVVVSFNVFHGMRRRIQERRQEIGVLRALGATPAMLRLAYSLEAAALGATGVACGVAAGMAVAGNLTALLALTESVSDALLAVASRFAAAPPARLELLAGSTFYLEVVPSRILLHEAVLTCAVAIGAGLIAALAAGRWLRVITPERILREART